MTKHMKMITLHLPEHMIERLDKAVEKKFAANRALAIREAIRDYLKEMGLWGNVGDR